MIDPRRVRRGRGRGFTLLELVLIITLIGILSRLTLPKLRTAAAAYDLDRSSRQFAADLQLAQSEAGRRGRTVTVTRVNATTYTLSVVNGATTTILRRQVMDGGSAFSASWNPIGFRPMGPPVLPVTAPLDIAIANASRSRTIRIAAGGAVLVRQ